MWNFLVGHRKCPRKMAFSIQQLLTCLAFFVSLFGHGACLPSCPSETNQNREQLPLPTLKLWRRNDLFLLLDAPGDKIVDLIATSLWPLVPSEVKIDGVMVTCAAPYPVLLVTLMASDSEEEFKKSSMVYPVRDVFYSLVSKPWKPDIVAQVNTSSFFETRSALFLRSERNVSVFACEAVDNPCLTSAGKLVVTKLGESLEPESLPFLNYTVRMTQNFQPHLHPFLTSSYNSLPKTSSCSSDNCTNISESSASPNATQAEPDCNAIFYYQFVKKEYSVLAVSKNELAYSCEFKDGSPGIVKNCWRRFSPGTTCNNCTKITPKTILLMEPFVPFCVSRETMPTLGSKEDDSTATIQIIYNDLIKKEDMEDGIRVVKGTPLYVGFLSGFNISSLDIETWDEGEDGGNERMIRMHVFEEVQLLNSVLKITCDSSTSYTTHVFLFALKFQNKTEPVVLQGNKTAFPRAVQTQYGYIYTQTINYHLNETIYLEVERILCFAPIQNSHNWINASRPLRVVSDVQDLFKPSSCQSPTSNTSLQLETHPKLVMKYAGYAGGNYSELVIPAEKETELAYDDVENYIECSANYPIELIHTSVPSDGQKVLEEFQMYSWQLVIKQERNGGTAINYIFSTRSFDLRAENVSNFFRCQSIENPCLHRSFQFFRLPRSFQNPLEIHFKLGVFPPGDPSQPETKKTELGRPPKHQECEALFLYKETPDKRGYEFRCEFPLEHQGTVNFHYCDTMNDCANTLRNRRQSPKCWRKVESWENCRFNCEMKKSDGFRPFVATCNYDQQAYGTKWSDLDGPRYRESTLGSFAVFALSTRPEELAPIYLSEEEIDPRKMTYLEPFESYQFPGKSLNVTCTVSAYFNGPEIVHSQMAKYFASRDEFEIVEGDDGSRRSILNKQGNYWSFTESIELGNDTDLSNISCIGLYWKGSNSSREIHLHAPESPEIALLVSDSLGERMIVGRGEKVGADQERQVFSPLSSTNVSLLCHGFGYPPPKISWATTAANKLDVFTQVVNITHRSSRVFFPVVDVGVEGTYICTATTNKQEQVSSSVRVRIKYPVSKSVVIISSVGSFVVLILILALLLFVRRVRKLKRTLRNLTDEEEKRFRFGDTTVDPTENNAGILAAAYDQSLEVSPDLIEIDEKSVLGAGEFGIVRSGFLKTNANDSKIPVAVKMPKFNVTTDNFISFLNEIKIMSHVQNHENVLQILGASTLSIKIRRALVALEFCELGNLKNFLRDKKHGFTNEFLSSGLTEWEQMDFSEDDGGYGDPRDLLPESEKLETLDLLNFSFGIANGMNFLAQKKVIHGDLAARNVLLTQNREVKISDFGFSTQLKSYENYKETNPLSIPWRWFPIEALVNRKFSLKSDCWSFGILLHEVFSLGEDPYPEFDRLDLNFIQRLRDGYRMQMPEFANEDIYDLMTECWRDDPHARPTFADVCEKILSLSSEIVAPKLNLI